MARVGPTYRDTFYMSILQHSLIAFVSYFGAEGQAAELFGLFDTSIVSKLPFWSCLGDLPMC